MKPQVLIIGTGNLAWHLAPNLQRIGLEPVLWSRKGHDDGFDWQSSIVPFSEEVSKVPYVAIFLAVTDDHIAAVSKRLSELFPPHIPVIHTSGATAIGVIDSYFTTRAALWPIRSLRKGEVIDNWNDLPLAYYSNTATFQDQLGGWAKAISQLTYLLDDKQRAQLHLAAVFSNNFTTWLCQIAYELCQDKAVPFEALIPIIKDTFSKIDANPPALRQTGAAIRGDQQTMNRHLKLLNQHPEYAKLYQKISGLIGQHN